uniref:Uncharacterized protein n=1 Tax=Siphoviridae sp. ctzlI32 TaxID=2827981 RepID=A0A8S5SY24_9CAUD|nr:MAG TPA: hypothetical protein [Siphoviridae sp. ctzlI32]DAH97971.1 MAG TPA: hypothetical protein [Caudoviricetes sp.]
MAGGYFIAISQQTDLARRIPLTCYFYAQTRQGLKRCAASDTDDNGSGNRE